MEVSKFSRARLGPGWLGTRLTLASGVPVTPLTGAVTLPVSRVTLASRAPHIQCQTGLLLAVHRP